jgi:hypothetical protein
LSSFTVFLAQRRQYEIELINEGCDMGHVHARCEA